MSTCDRFAVGFPSMEALLARLTLRTWYRPAMSRSAIVDTRGTPWMSLAEWAALPEDEPGELVDGRIEAEEVASPTHEVVTGSLLRTLGNWVVPQGGLMLGSSAKYAVRPPSRGRMPDVSAFFAGRRMPPRAGVITIPPDLAIEVVSPSPRDGRRDRVEKLKEYAAFGIRWYWLIDPAIRSLEILELGADRRYVHAVDITEGVIEEVPGCQGLRFDLDALWAEIDRLGPEEGEAEGGE